MKFLISFCFMLSLSIPLWADENLLELETIIQDQLMDSQTKLHQSSDQEGTFAVTKEASMQEMLVSLDDCKDKEAIRTNKQVGPDVMTIAYSCRNSKQEIITSEVFISTRGERPEILSFQELKFQERELPPSVMLNIIAKSDFESINASEQVSPGIRTILTIAKVGIPVALSFKTAKILFPTRSDWQKHFIAGAVISGATVLTTQGLIRTVAKKRGYHLSDLKINLLSSVAGLLASTAAGASKELYDRYSGRGTPEFRDALYTAAGGAMVSFTVVIPLESLFRSQRVRPNPALL